MYTLITARAMFNREFYIMVEDTGKTFNINMHTYFCFALSVDEAIGKMYREHPELLTKKILSIDSIIDGITIKESQKVKRLNDGKVFTMIVPDPELGLYKSLMKLKDRTEDWKSYIEMNLVKLNPKRFVDIA